MTDDHGTPRAYLGGCRCDRCLSVDLLVPELTARLRCSEWAARRLINAPKGIRAAKIANKWRIRAEDVETYIDGKANRTRRRRRRAS